MLYNFNSEIYQKPSAIEKAGLHPLFL